MKQYNTIIGRILASLMLILTFSQQGIAQHAYFAESGQIEYEKKVNMYAKLQADISEDDIFAKKIYEDYRKNGPQFVNSTSVLSFSQTESLYEFQKQDELKGFANDPWLLPENITYRNLQTDSVLSVKTLYGDTYVVQDSGRSILWKITTETREIAGYQCRRANGLVQDSIYVVAFYTDEILPSVGPESFSGLPGAILGVALPHDNVSWFATKVTVKNTPVQKPKSFPRRSKFVNYDDFVRTIKSSLGGRGNWADNIIKAFTL